MVLVCLGREVLLVRRTHPVLYEMLLQLEELNYKKFWATFLVPESFPEELHKQSCTRPLSSKQT